MKVLILVTGSLKGVKEGGIGRRHISKGAPVKPLQVKLNLTTQPLLFMLVVPFQPLQVMLDILVQPLQVKLNLTTQPLWFMLGAPIEPL